MTIKLLFDKPAFAKKSFQKFVIHSQGQPFISINSKMNHADYQLIFYLKLFKSLLFSSKILKIFLNFLWFCPFLKKFEGAWRFIDNWYTKFQFQQLSFLTVKIELYTYYKVVNGPTSSGPNPKTNLKPKSCPKKNER